MVVVADLAGDVAEAGSGEPWRAFRDDDVGAVDGAQVAFLVEGPEDACGQGRRGPTGLR